MQPKSDEGVPQITIRQIAERCGIDPSSVRKDLRKMGVVPDRVPHSHFGATTMLAITPEEFERFLEDRRARGLSTDCDGGTRDWKWFYAIRIDPDRDPPGVYRVKLGIGQDYDERLGRHRSLMPTAQILKFWHCQPTWERPAIVSISRKGVLRAYSRELFDFDDIDAMLARGDAFFANMPVPAVEQRTAIVPRGPSQVAPSVDSAAGRRRGTEGGQAPPPDAARATSGATTPAPSSGDDQPGVRRLRMGVQQVNMQFIFQE